MKLALRYIPTEVWVDVICYPWISRKKLGKIVDKFRNRYFAEILQYCLHERGKLTLGSLYLDKKTIIPQTPMPENIKFFKNIKISHFDSYTLDFLRQISPLFIDVNLHLAFNSDLTNLRPIHEHLAPMLHGIHSMTLGQMAIPFMEQYFVQKLAQVKMLTILFDINQLDRAPIQTNINFCMNWLTSEEQDSTKPRLLSVLFCTDREGNFQQFVMAVRQQFLMAKTPYTFTIEVLDYDSLDQVDNFHLKNNLGEQLDGEFDEYGDFWIYRHKQVDFARTQLEEWVKVAVQKSYKSSGIELFSFTTIGQIDANAGLNGVDDNVGEEKDQQSTFKKPN